MSRTGPEQIHRILYLCLAGMAFTSSALRASSGFEKIVSVGYKDSVVLELAVTSGDVEVGYSREGQVSIYALVLDGAGKDVSREFFESALSVEKSGNHVTIRNFPTANFPDFGLTKSFRIGVPSRAEVSSVVFGSGNQTLMGVTGPATIITGTGDIDVSLVRPGLLRAQTGKGKISCTRVAQLEVETASGTITLMEDGPSKATVKKGFGRIEVGGARGAFAGSTDKGELHVKASVWDDWQLHSTSGNIRLELPRRAKFDADVSTQSGEISIERADMEKAPEQIRELRQKVNGGGRNVRIRSDGGSILIE